MSVDLQTLADSMDADDYPGSDIIRAASAEIDNLRRWKANEPLHDVVDLKKLGVTAPVLVPDKP